MRVVGWLLAGSVLGTGPAAFAHAFLERATPAVGATVEASPSAVELEFNEAVEAAFSSVEVTDRGTNQPIRGQPLEHPEPERLVMPLPELGAGTYEVHWKVVSLDRHATEGSFKFEVAPR